MMFDKIKEIGKTDGLKESFERIKEKMIGDLKNFYYEQTYQQAFALFECLMLNSAVEQEAIRKIMENYSYEDF